MTDAQDLPSGPVMFVAEVIAEAIGQQIAVEDLRNGMWWLSGGCAPQSAGCKLNLRDVAEAVLLDIWQAGYAPTSGDPGLLAALQEIADSHIPSQPMDSGGDDLVWAQRHVGRLRGIAAAAIAAARVR